MLQIASYSGSGARLQRLFRQILTAACGGLASTLVFTVPSSAYHLRVLHAFCSRAGCSDGSKPNTELLLDSAGNVYGTTQFGGDHDKGVVFRLSYDAGRDKWIYKRLYSFCHQTTCPHGGNPVDPLIIDTAGNLYGTVDSAFELSPTESGHWTFTILRRFNDINQTGVLPSSALTYAGKETGVPYDGASPLYGVTLEGGKGVWRRHCTGCGVLYELRPHRPDRPGSRWRETVLYNFCTQGDGCPDGSFPARSLAVGASGTIYGTTFGGGTKNKGIVYAVSGSSLTALHSFCSMNHCADGDGGSGVVRDAQENLYGVSSDGGVAAGGVAFRITPAGKFKVLYSFCQLAGCTDGNGPFGDLLLNADGSILGTTVIGGANGKGVAYKLRGNRQKVLYDFCSKLNCKDGDGPGTGLVMDSSGTLYGTTIAGGRGGEGVVFELSP